MSSGRIAGWSAVALAGAGGVAVGGYALRNTTYAATARRAVDRSGFVEKTSQVDGATLHYAEGPANGPPLLLVHGQMVDWTNYLPALPELARHFQVFAVDCYGHGGSARVPQRYTNLAMGRDLAHFLRVVIGEPAYVSGNSSGGLLAITIALEVPGLVRGLVLEDPPLFSSVNPRFPTTAGYDLARSAHAFLASSEADFASWYVRDSSMTKLLGGLGQRMVHSALARRGRGESIRWWYLPPMINEIYRRLDRYDPEFGEAFYTGRWHDGFDHADALARLKVPTVLIHADWQLDPRDGTLLGAMDDQDAARARSLIKDVDFRRLHALHAVHFAKPHLFNSVVIELAAQPGAPLSPHTRRTG
ncbi:MAG: alpha/beta hydrolase [Propionicimonas sp.]